VTDYINSLDEHQRIADLRKRVLGAFEKSSWPKTDEEEWRRTDLSVFDLDDLGTPDAELREKTGAEIKHGRIHRLNDVLNVSGELIPPAVVDRIFTELGRMADNPANRITLWNLLQSEDIFVLHVPRGTDDKELHELCWHSLGEDVSRHATVVVVAEEMSSARIAIRMKGMSGHLQTIGAVYLVDDAAKLGVSVLQESSDEVLALYQAEARVGRDARLLHFEGILGGGFVKNRVEVGLAGSGSDLVLDGLYFTDGEQHVDLRTVQHHQAEHASSRTYYKGVMKDESEAVFQGLIEVNHEARGTDAYLTNNNLILNDGAKADSIPSLNIKTDDVKCSHGSTTGRIDEEQIYYLQCRGFTRKEAEEMLIIGFFEDLLHNLPGNMQDDVRQQIHRRLKGSF
jgi:Fe-S cluster assembly protein SufD